MPFVSQRTVKVHRTVIHYCVLKGILQKVHAAKSNTSFERKQRCLRRQYPTAAQQPPASLFRTKVAPSKILCEKLFLKRESYSMGYPAIKRLFCRIFWNESWKIISINRNWKYFIISLKGCASPGLLHHDIFQLRALYLISYFAWMHFHEKASAKSRMNTAREISLFPLNQHPK